MEHSLRAQLSRLIYNLERWEDVLDRDTAVTTERVERWKIGLEADLQQALEDIRTHFDDMLAS